MSRKARQRWALAAAAASGSKMDAFAEAKASSGHTENDVRGEDILARLKVIDQRLRELSIEEAACVLAEGLTCAGIDPQERLRLVAETERILNELDGRNDG